MVIIALPQGALHRRVLPGEAENVRSFLCKLFDSTCIFLVVLKRCGVGLQDLVKCYCTFVRPILEYAVQVWHPGLTSDQSELLERVQKHVLRILLPQAKYPEALAAAGVATLEQRRVELCRRFASGLQESPEFFDWLLSSRAECHGRNLGSKNKLTVMQARTRGLMCSPVAYFTDLLSQ